MKNYLLLLGVITTFSFCNAQNINTEKEMASLYKNVKFRQQAVEYRANLQIGACNFELLINDLPVEQYFGDASGTFNTSTPVNDAILRSGTQRWKLIVYPGYRNNQKLEQLSPHLLIDIGLERIAQSKHGQVGDASPVKLATTPFININGQSVYADAGKETAIYEGTFTAEVPYSLTGWSAGQDLTKEDQSKLLAEVLDFYQQYAALYKEKNINGIFKSVLAKEKERAQYFFMDASANAEAVTTYKEFLDFPSPAVLPIENYRLRFYGDGKIVTLERTDYPNIGEPVTRIEYKDQNGKTVTEYMYCYLQRPAGSTRLEMIR